MMDLNNKVVLVTGGTGSFGRKFAKTVLSRYTLKKLIVVSRDELTQSEMHREFPEKTIRYFIGARCVTGQTLVIDSGHRFLALDRDVQFLGDA